MLSIELAIANASGLHARPAALFVRTAAAFRSDVRVRNLGRSVPPVDAKSILGVLGLGVGRGAVIEVTAEGEDESEAEEVVNRARRPYPQQIDNRKILVRGQTAAGRYLQVIYLLELDDVVFAIHARPLTEREKRRLRRRRK